ncbi:MAG TPA: hypothetical protein VN736_22800 [Candidatus Limnocylindrales bacterium]|nr:hypothetical protein [Candidatus Limnocylindrales bacterium]
MDRLTLNNVRLLTMGVLALGLSAAALVGCGSSSGTSGSSPQPAASSTASGGASATPASGKPIDVCAVLPAASAAKLSGAAFTTANPMTNLQPQEYGCNYSNDADNVQAEIKIFEHNAVVTYNFLLNAAKNAQPVRGLGDKAFFDNDGTMYVLAGGNLIQVNGLKTADQCTALARPILAAL